MSWMSHPVTVYLRNTLRSSGLSTRIAQIISRPGYEDAFRSAMTGAICHGYYTVLFAELTGDKGHVTALEPEPEAFEKLKVATATPSNCTVICKAIGEKSGIMAFVVSGTTSHIVEQRDASAIAVPLTTGDQLIASSDGPVPQVVKVDIEGFELEAVRGMAETLSRSELRFIGVEVHFSALSERDLADAPNEIKQQLIGAGMKTKWISSSHLTGERM